MATHSASTPQFLQTTDWATLMLNVNVLVNGHWSRQPCNNDGNLVCNNYTETQSGIKYSSLIWEAISQGLLIKTEVNIIVLAIAKF
jgi:hypothetical protein